MLDVQPVLDKWDCRFIRLAKEVSTWSKDPSTQVGAVVANSKKVHGLGYNGFPQGIEDTDARLNDREIKYSYVIHAEVNALLSAGDHTFASTLYVYPLFSCADCAKIAIQRGIVRVVAANPLEARWASRYALAIKMYEEAGVKVHFYNVADFDK